ncbi:MAG: hypothetical protein JOZ58_25070 [Acetobacteraceae bacterium]|nr:hypothetical protein [Acetobacteraceae bacterium]
MKPITTFGLAVVLSSVLAAPGFAAVGSEQAREANARNQPETSSQTTTPWSSTMSSANTPSHDGNSQLGKDQRNTGNAHYRAGTLSNSDHQLGRRDSTNPAATNPGCGGAC